MLKMLVERGFKIVSSALCARVALSGARGDSVVEAVEESVVDSVADSGADSVGELDAC